MFGVQLLTGGCTGMDGRGGRGAESLQWGMRKQQEPQEHPMEMDMGKGN